MDGDNVLEPEGSNGVSCEHNKQYIDELINERQNLNPSFVHAAKLLDLGKCDMLKWIVPRVWS